VSHSLVVLFMPSLTPRYLIDEAHKRLSLLGCPNFRTKSLHRAVAAFLGAGSVVS